jgi:hypothetical protein
VEPPCTGCLELKVPFTAASQNAQFQLLYPDPGEDFTDTVVTFHVRAPEFDPSGQLFVQPFVMDADFDPFVQGSFLPISDDTFDDNDNFFDIDIDVGAVTTADFDVTTVRAIGLQVLSGATLPGPATAVLLLDSITFDGAGVPDLEFTDDEEDFAVSSAGPGATITHH